jgi:hemoglobin/transferrin/lactoferrin receptor protein
MKKYALLSLLPCLTSALTAQDFLDPLVVTASRSATNTSDLPYTVNQLDSDFIEQNHRRTLPDTLQYTPGVLVQRTAYGHGSPFIRGFTGRQNLLLVDGVRLNNSTWRSGPVQYWSTVDAFSIDRLELVKSQGSVLYGSDAIGGTLNAFTKSSDFRDRPAGEFFHTGSAYYEYRTNGEGSQLGRVESAFGIGDRFGVFLGLSAKEFGDIEDSSVGRMRGTGYPEQDIDFRFDFALNADTTLTLAHQYVNQDDISRWHRTTLNPGWNHDGHIAAPGTFISNLYDQERSLTYLKMTGEPEGEFISRWSATLSYQNTQDSESQLRTLVDQRLAVIDLATWGFDISLESDIGSGTLVYGLDYYMDEAQSAAYRNGVFRATDRPVADDASYHLLGAFTQYEWKPSDRYSITGGIRYTYAEAEWDFYRAAGGPAVDRGGSGDWDDFSASIRGLVNLDDRWAVYGGLSQAFRAPNLSDLTGTTLSLAGLTAQGSPNLEAEKYLTAEIGTRYIADDISFSLAAFHTWTSDAITNIVTGPTSTATNGQDGFIYGFEAEGAWQFAPDWMLSGMMAWNEGKTETAANGERWITRLLPFTSSVALRWTRPDDRLWIEGRVLGAVGEGRIHPADQAADNQRIPTGGTPGYVTASLTAGYRVNDHLELTTAVENVFDATYRNHGSGQNEPGLNGILSAKLFW